MGKSEKVRELTTSQLKPLGEQAYGGNVKPFLEELNLLKNDIDRSALYTHFVDKYIKTEIPKPIMINALKVSGIAEKALIYLFSEENIIGAGQMEYLAGKIGANTTYMNERLVENRKMQVRATHKNLRFQVSVFRRQTWAAFVAASI